MNYGVTGTFGSFLIQTEFTYFHLDYIYLNYLKISFVF